MTAPGFALFDTAIGRCGISWGAQGITGIALPEARVAETRARLRERFPGVKESKLPAHVEAVCADIVAMLGGKASTLASVTLDMSGVPAFHKRVYEAARKIAPGETSSYGEIASRVGSPGAARAVGQALGRNPFAIIVPCHRVLAANGKIGGFTANGGLGTKRALLALENAGARTAAPGERHAAAVRALRGGDAALARIIEAVGACGLVRNETQSVFLALAESIVYQQLTGKAAATIFGRVRALFPRSKNGFTPRDILGATDDDLRGAGLSRAKVLALRDLARRTASGELPTLEVLEGMDDEAVVEALTTVRGIGRWTAEMFLMFRLGRGDVLPLDDYGVRKGFASTLGLAALPTKKELADYGERWKPHRSVASWYLWRAAELK
jgi:methylated-DNA-[protein]-cysteine S-methyltransferase